MSSSSSSTSVLERLLREALLGGGGGGGDSDEKTLRNRAIESCPATKSVQRKFEFEFNVEELAAANDIDVNDIETQIFPDDATFYALLGRDIDSVSITAHTKFKDGTELEVSMLSLRVENPEQRPLMEKHLVMQAEEALIVALAKRVFVLMLRIGPPLADALKHVVSLQLKNFLNMQYVFAAKLGKGPEMFRINRLTLDDAVQALCTEVETDRTQCAIMQTMIDEANGKWMKHVDEHRAAETKKHEEKTKREEERAKARNAAAAAAAEADKERVKTAGKADVSSI